MGGRTTSAMAQPSSPTGRWKDTSSNVSDTSCVAVTRWRREGTCNSQSMGSLRNWESSGFEVPSDHLGRRPQREVHRRAGCEKSARPVRRAGCGNEATTIATAPHLDSTNLRFTMPVLAPAQSYKIAPKHSTRVDGPAFRLF